LDVGSAGRKKRELSKMGRPSKKTLWEARLAACASCGRGAGD